MANVRRIYRGFSNAQIIFYKRQKVSGRCQIAFTGSFTSPSLQNIAAGHTEPRHFVTVCHAIFSIQKDVRAIIAAATIFLDFFALKKAESARKERREHLETQGAQKEENRSSGSHHACVVEAAEHA